MSVTLILRISAAALLLGRGWQSFFGDLPLRTVFWNQDLLQPIVEGVFGVSWKDYVTSLVLDQVLNLVTYAVGIFFFSLGIWVATGWKKEKLNRPLIVSSALLAIIFLLKFMAKSFYIGMLIEHGVQLIAPLAYAWILGQTELGRNRETILKVAIASTFVGHALFAVGFHPVPGHFVDMIINVFGFNESTAKELLLLAGSLDIACALFLFIPPLDRYALMFMIGWGTITATARVIAHVDLEQFWYSYHQWGVEMIYRLPHGLLPLAIFISKKDVIITRNAVVR